MTPTEVRDELVRTGFDIQGRANIMAEVHTILKRLAAQKRRIEAIEKDGSAYYFYREPEGLRTVGWKALSPKKKA
jgi:hypothetical protein